MVLLSSGIVLFSSGVTAGFARETAVIRFPTGVTYQDAYLKASNTEVQDYFGTAVAVSGDTLVVGSPDEDGAATGVNGDQTDNTAADSGAVYVFTRAGDGWVQQAYLKASNAEAGDYFGQSVAIAEDTIVVGAYGEDSAALGVNGNPSDNSAAYSGAAYIFTRSNGVWSQQAYLKASNSEANDLFGFDVAINDHTVIVGAPGEDSSATGVNGNESDNSASYSGAAYVFTFAGGAWSQQAYLKASNTGTNDQFGTSIAVSEDTVVVGAYKEDSSAIGVNGNQTDNSAVDSGATYIFFREGGAWNQQAYLKASNTGTEVFLDTR
jgi:hypothetical protein